MVAYLSFPATRVRTARWSAKSSLFPIHVYIIILCGEHITFTMQSFQTTGNKIVMFVMFV